MDVVERNNFTKKQLIEEINRLRERIIALEAESERHQRADELLHIFRINSPIGLFVIQDGKFVFVNKEFQRILGIKGEELVGTNSLERVCIEDREMVREKAKKMLCGELISPYKYRVISKRGKPRWILEGVVSVQYQGQRAVLGHSLDITEHITSEAKLRKLLAKEKKLRQELEEEVNKRIEYTRALVHELKTPLTSLLLSGELLVNELHEEPLSSVARNIYHGANNLNNRIDELLDLAKVEIGSLQIVSKWFDAFQFMNNIADYVEPIIRKNKQHLVRDISANLPEIWADEERLHQIVLNLLINAMKFTPEGGTITLIARVKDGSFIVKVKDTGMGISREDQKKLFEPYQRLQSDRERLSGLGLGLSLCKNLVELHHGKICVKSKVGEGTTFTFVIPYKASVEAKGDAI